MQKGAPWNASWGQKSLLNLGGNQLLQPGLQPAPRSGPTKEATTLPTASDLMGTPFPGPTPAQQPLSPPAGRCRLCDPASRLSKAATGRGFLPKTLGGPHHFPLPPEDRVQVSAPGPADGEGSPVPRLVLESPETTVALCFPQLRIQSRGDDTGPSHVATLASTQRHRWWRQLQCTDGAEGHWAGTEVGAQVPGDRKVTGSSHRQGKASHAPLATDAELQRLTPRFHLEQFCGKTMKSQASAWPVSRAHAGPSVISICPHEVWVYTDQCSLPSGAQVHAGLWGNTERHKPCLAVLGWVHQDWSTTLDSPGPQLLGLPAQPRKPGLLPSPALGWLCQPTGDPDPDPSALEELCQHCSP